jgi:hypothetical protein
MPAKIPFASSVCVQLTYLRGSLLSMGHASARFGELKSSARMKGVVS